MADNLLNKSNEVYPFTNEEVTLMLDVFNKNIDNAKTETKKQKAMRDKLLFTLGINLGIRINDLRLLRWNFFFNDNNEPKVYYTMYPQNLKNKCNYVKLYFNKYIFSIIYEYIELYPYDNLDEYIFKSNNNIPITIQTIWNILKNTSKTAKINKNIGGNSLRKTWAYNALKCANNKEKTLVILQYCFNHQSPQKTLKYIGFTDEDIIDSGLKVVMNRNEDGINLKFDDD